jgi:hypothetical protein
LERPDLRQPVPDRQSDDGNELERPPLLRPSSGKDFGSRCRHGSPKQRTGEDQISLTDPDSRAMAAHTKVGVGYNIQVAVDAKLAGSKCNADRCAEAVMEFRLE